MTLTSIIRKIPNAEEIIPHGSGVVEFKISI